jgi:hypothetical protein
MSDSLEEQHNTPNLTSPDDACGDNRTSSRAREWETPIFCGREVREKANILYEGGTGKLNILYEGGAETTHAAQVAAEALERLAGLGSVPLVGARERCAASQGQCPLCLIRSYSNIRSYPTIQPSIQQ